MPEDAHRKPGIVYTFYSFKGGVGRSMALANVAALLAKWGRSVLVVDWDLEASGIERFFLGTTPGLADLRRSTPGVVDLIRARADEHEIDWEDCLLSAYPFGAASGAVFIITAGRNDEGYSQRMQGLDFARLFEDHDLGSYIEKLRKDWIWRFDTVLVDSRTGITDIGGICTIHLPDVLVLLFTTTESSVDGVIEVMKAAREQQTKLPFDRRRLLALPVPARDESRTEYEKAEEWKRRFAERFSDYYKDWLPAERTPIDVLDLLRIPYIPFWSFGEPLPVVEQGTSDPSSLGAAYEVLGRLIETDLEWTKVLSGEIISPPVARIERVLDEIWLGTQRAKALAGLKRAGYMELWFHSPNVLIDQPQDELLKAARRATVHTFGWPIGVVLDNRDDLRPRPTKDGIFAQVDAPDHYDYWYLTKQGDFYALSTLFEDTRSENAIFFNTRVVRVAEALMYCGRLYRNLGANGNATIRFVVRHAGLRGRVLTATSNRPWLANARSVEDDVAAGVSFLLEDVENNLVELTRKLCEPLFLIFDFERFDTAVYSQIVTDFVNGRVT